MSQTLGNVLYRSAFRTLDSRSQLALTYSGTPIAGYPVLNVSDWRDWTSCTITAGAETIQATMTEDRLLSGFAWLVTAPNDLTAGDFSMAVQYRNSAVGGWATLATIVINDSGLLGIARFAEIALPIGAQVRILFGIPVGQTLNVRQLAPGYLLEFPIGQHVGIAPAPLQGSFTPTNVVSVNGSFIGRDLIRREVKGTIALDHLSEVWVRAYWNDFAKHAVRYAFVYAWDLTDHPADVVFAWADELNGPEFAAPTRMKVTLPWSGLVEPLPETPYAEVLDPVPPPEDEVCNVETLAYTQTVLTPLIGII